MVSQNEPIYILCLANVKFSPKHRTSKTTELIKVDQMCHKKEIMIMLDVYGNRVLDKILISFYHCRCYLLRQTIINLIRHCHIR